MHSVSCFSKCRTAPTRPSLAASIMPPLPRGQHRELSGAENSAFRSFFCIRLQKKSSSQTHPPFNRIYKMNSTNARLGARRASCTTYKAADPPSPGAGRPPRRPCRPSWLPTVAGPTSRTLASSFCNRSAASSLPSCLASCAGVRPQANVNDPPWHLFHRGLEGSEEDFE